MEQDLELVPIDVEKLVRRDDFDVSHKKRGLKPSAGNSLLNADVCDADFVDNISVCRNDRMVRFTSKDVNDAARLVIVSGFTAEQWPGRWVRNAPPSLIAVQRAYHKLLPGMLASTNRDNSRPKFLASSLLSNYIGVPPSPTTTNGAQNMGWAK